MSKNNANMRRRNNENRRRQLPFNKPPNYPSAVPTMKQNVQGSTKTVELNYDLSTEIFSSGSGPIVLDVYKVNSPYDFLQSLFTNAVQFLNYNFALYTRAKVQSLCWTIYFGNLEQYPVDLYWFETPFNPITSFPTRSAVIAMAGTGNCIWRDTLTEQYGKKSQVTFRRRVAVGRQIVGNKPEYNGSPDYSFTQTADPAILVYSNWVAVSPLSTFSLGVTCKVDVSIRVKFYDRIAIVTPLLTVEQKQNYRALCSRLRKEAEPDTDRPVEGDTVEDEEEEFKGEIPSPSAVKSALPTTSNALPAENSHSYDKTTVGSRSLALAHPPTGGSLNYSRPTYNRPGETFNVTPPGGGRKK